ncbi:hypothetical protein LCGC14_1096250 [marine sediment metagenome]|uniref:Uncharacterized protein n=1 Tax=marine sediment metagenome TaxID=412755 RepID=A0A0F9MF77_9ZZZZ
MAVATKTRPIVMDLPEVLAVCQHHWVIESANGPSSKGHCKLCGDSRAFSNSMPMESWERKSTAIGRELALMDRIGGY